MPGRRRALPLLLLFALTACPASERVDESGGSSSGNTPNPSGSTGAEAPRRGAGDTAQDSFRFVAPEAPAPSQSPVDAPLSLTASDGSGLQLVSLDAQGIVEGPLAFTQLSLRFRNPEPRVREGRFRITLPENASISRFAMKIRGRWMEGEVVERQKARRTYEDFLHRRQDPALLEQAAGNEFTARVFPIPANAEKELIISFSHELERADEPYVIPLRGLPQLDALNIRVLVGKDEASQAATSLGGTTERHQTVTVEKKAWVPDRDFEVSVPEASHAGLRFENLAVARVTPVTASEPDGVRGLTVLVDTSASRALGFNAQVKLLGRLVDGLTAGAGADTPLRVLAFDQETAPIFEGRAKDFGSDAKAKLHDRRALGASDLVQALEWLAAHPSEDRHDRLVIISDGVATAGDVDGEGAAAAARALAPSGIVRIDALALGGLRDSERLTRITTSGVGRDGVVLDGDAPIEQIGRRLSQSTASGLDVKVAGAKWVWPRTLEGVQPGDEVLVFADLPQGKPFALSIGGKAVDLGDAGLRAAPQPLLQRAWVRARIARLMHQAEVLGAEDPDLRAALKQQVIKLSTTHRVLSPYTALLVLETERDYRRYGIARTALADILTVGATGVTVLAEKERQIAPPPRPRPVPRKPAPRRRVQARRASTGDRSNQGMIDDTPADAPATAAAESAPVGDPRLVPNSIEPVEAPSADRFDGAEESKAGEAAPLGSLSTRGSGAGGGGAADFADEDAEGDLRAPMAESEAVREPPRRAPAPPRAAPAPPPPPEERPRPRRRRARREVAADRGGRQGTSFGVGGLADGKKKQRGPDPLTGPLAEVMALIAKGDVAGARAKAEAWREEKPGDVLALIALGEALERQGDNARAARAYGSIIDLFPARADLLRFAAYRLERINTQAALRVARDAYDKAVKQRPDHPAGHRGLAFALVKASDYEGAFEALEYGLAQRYPSRFPGVQRILREDLGLVAAAWKAHAPKMAAQIDARLTKAGGSAATGPSLRFVLTWETDANDVDFHIHDGRGGHAYYSSTTLPSGGALYADVTTGYGPECFTIPGEARAFPYRLEAHYYRKGPMGYGMGRLQIVAHDGKGGLRFDERPYVVMVDGAYLDLGTVDAKWQR